MSIKDILKKIFSVEDISYIHKQLYLFGIRIKLPRKITENPCFNDLPIENDKIIFKTTSGSYNCNPKYIAEEIIRRNLPYKLVWSVNQNIDKFKDDFPKNIKLVMEYTDEDFKETKTAKFIIDNERRTVYIRNGILKRQDQIYIQTFHGSMGLKKTGLERKNANIINWRTAKKDAESIDYLTSNSAWETDFFKKMFFDNGKIIEIGHPRNDILFKDNTEIKNKVFKKLNIPNDKKIVLYAPTLREDKDMSCYTLDYNEVINSLKKRFGGEWILVAKLHPLMVEYKDQLKGINGSNIINATTYSDIQELMAASDCLITDYSSCILDFLLSGKYGFIYATDEKNYDNERGLYYPLRSTPFPVATNMQEMINNIENFDENLYTQKAKEFLKDKGCIEDGNAAKKVVDLIESYR